MPQTQQSIPYIEGYVESAIERAAYDVMVYKRSDNLACLAEYHQGRLDALMELARAARLDIRIGTPQ
jgi:Ni,Fe-hydrogenase III large subunit